MCSMLTKRMAMRRMNELWRRMALTLVFHVLLFHTCQWQSVSANTESPQPTDVMTDPIPDGNGTSGDPAVTTDTTNLTYSPTLKGNNSAIYSKTDHPSITIPYTLPGSTISQAATIDEQTGKSLATMETTTIQPVGNSNEAGSYKSDENTIDKYIENQENQAIQGEQGVVSSSPGQSEPTPVFVPLLVSGLILAAALIGLYAWKNHCCTKANGMKLTEESCMVDVDTQGNTLVSVAPLNPPESQEKPSQNGESLEAVKTQNAPTATNGHSTAKADTEL